MGLFIILFKFTFQQSKSAVLDLSTGPIMRVNV